MHNDRAIWIARPMPATVRLHSTEVISTCAQHSMVVLTHRDTCHYRIPISNRRTTPSAITLTQPCINQAHLPFHQNTINQIGILRWKTPVLPHTTPLQTLAMPNHRSMHLLDNIHRNIAPETAGRILLTYKLAMLIQQQHCSPILG